MTDNPSTMHAPRSAPRRRRAWPFPFPSGIWGVAGLFAGAQLCCFLWRDFPLARLETDGIFYMQQALGPLFQLNPYHGPGYPWTLKAMLALTPLNPFAAARAVSLLSGLTMVLCTAWLARRIAGPATAVPAALLAACSPALFTYSGMAMSDAQGAALFMSSLLLVLPPRNPAAAPHRFLAAGALAGAAYLTRYVYGMLLPLGLGAAWLMGRPLRRRAFLLFLLAFLLVTFPWLVFVGSRTGNPFWNLNHLNIAFHMYRGTMGWNLFPAPERFAGLADVIASDPWRFIRSWLRSLAHVPRGMAAAASWPVILAALMGIGLLARRGTRRQAPGWITSGLAFALYTGAICLVWIEPRFLLALLPAAASMAAFGAVTLPECLPLGPGMRPPARLALVLVLTVAATGFTVRRTSELLNREPREYRAAAEWFKTKALPSSTRILAAKPHVAFFAGYRHLGFREIALQYADLPVLENILAATDAQFLVFDARYAAAEFPALVGLLDTARAPPYLLVVYQVDFPERLVVYRILTHANAVDQQ